MPDYNPAVAAGFQPQQTNVLGTLEGISQLQIGQAHAGLYSLQALQQQRQYNALQAASAYIRDNPGDARGALQTYYGGGGDPAGGPSLVNSMATANAISATPGGMLPSEYSQRVGAQKTLAEIPGAVAESQTKQSGALKARTEADAAAAKQYGPGVLIDPSNDESWAGLVNAHYDALGVDRGDLGRQAALNVKDPNGRTRAAIAYGAAAGVPVQDLAKTFNVNQPEQQQPGQAQQPPTIGLKTPGQQKQVDYYDKLHSGIEALGNTSASSMDDIHLAKAALNDPNFYSGTGAAYNLMAKRFVAMGLGDPAKALPQEVFSKVMAANILQQTNGMKAAAEEMGANSSRLFASQIELMEKAAQNPENTAASNRFLTEMAERMANKNITLADKANNYKGGVLDPTFENQFRKDASKPIFSNWELSHLDTIGAPMGDKLKQIDPREIEHLKANPKNVAQFDSYYGPGTSKAALAQ